MRFTNLEEIHKFVISRVKPLKKPLMVVCGGLGALGGEWVRNRYLDAEDEKKFAVKRFNTTWQKFH